MKKQLLATLKCAAMMSLVLGFALSAAWAAPKQKSTRTKTRDATTTDATTTDASAADSLIESEYRSYALAPQHAL